MAAKRNTAQIPIRPPAITLRWNIRATKYGATNNEKMIAMLATFSV